MRWFHFGRGKRRVQHDPARQQALVREARERFGPQTPMALTDQRDAVVALLDGDDGLLAAAAIVREFAEAANADLVAQVNGLGRQRGQMLTVQRWSYRSLWQTAGGQLGWNLFALPCRLVPYVHVSAAAAVIGARAGRAVQITMVEPVLAQLFEVLDLVTIGWEYGKLPVDTFAVDLANQLILTAQQLRGAMKTPPPLPPPVRELMRRNNSLDIHDPTDGRIVGAFNPGKHLRESLLV